MWKAHYSYSRDKHSQDSNSSFSTRKAKVHIFLRVAQGVHDTSCATHDVSADNFVEDVLGGFQFEVATPYVLYRNKLDEV